MPVCFDELKKLLGEEIPDEFISSVLKDIESIKSTSQELGEFRARAKEYLDDKRFLLAANRKEYAQNRLKTRERNGFYQQPAFKGDGVEGVLALLRGSDRLSLGGNASVALATTTYRNKWYANLRFSLEKTGLWDVFKKGGLEREVMQELFEMRAGGRAGVSGSPVAQGIAKVLKGVQKDVLNSLRRSGVAIGEIPGYIMRQSHDKLAIREAGFDAWKQSILPHLDWKRTFGAERLDDDSVTEFMEKVFDDIIYGKIDKADGEGLSDQLITISKNQKLGNRLKKSRTLHFKDGNSFFEYNSQFGQKSLYDAVVTSIDYHAKNVALIERFGTDPKAAILADLKRMERGASEEHARKLRDAFDPERETGKIGVTFAEISGQTTLPGFSTMAKVGAGARALTNMAKLGYSVLSTTGDLAAAVSTLRASTGKGFLAGGRDLVSSFISVVKPSERKIWAERLAIMTEDLLGEFHDRFSAGEGSPPGVISRAQNLYFKLNGLTYQSAIGKVAVARQFALELADHAPRGFEELTPRVRANLERYGLNAQDWRLAARGMEEVSGLKALTPEGIRALPDADFAAAARAQGLRISGSEYREQVARKIGFYLTDHAELGLPTPGVRERAFLLRGTRADDPMGQLLRFIAQFKSYPLMAHKLMSRAALSDPEGTAKTLGQAILKPGSGDVKGMVGFMVSSTLMGYVAMEARNLAKGNGFSDPERAATWTEAFLKGGSAGLYGDFLMGNYSNFGRSLLGDMAGPALSTANQASQLWSRAWSGEAGKDDLAMFLRNNAVPNLFYVKPALDYLILDEVQDTLSPGWKEKRELKKLRQDYRKQLEARGGG